MKQNTKKMALIGILTALYVVLSMIGSIPIYGNIKFDIGYIALAISCYIVGPWAGIVGALGCGLESILFTSLGFSVGWFVMNAIIGTCCGYLFNLNKFRKPANKIIIDIFLMIVIVAIGITAKTLIECLLYSIPIAVKLPKSLVAFVVDIISMSIGIIVYNTTNVLYKYKTKK